MLRILSTTIPAKPLPQTPARPFTIPPPTRRKTTLLSATSSSSSTPVLISPPPPRSHTTQTSNAVVSTYHSLILSRTPRPLLALKAPELGLLSLLFVLSVGIGSILSLAIVSIPTMWSFKRLATSMTKLSEVVSDELAGTLSSLKLSGIEISELTKQLSKLRQTISGNKGGKRERGRKFGSFGRSNYSNMDFD